MAALLQDRVTAQAQLLPEGAAVVLDGASLSYGRLESLSNRIAWALREHGCARGDRVGLLMPKSPMAIACLLGIYKADCIYVPLDPAGPAARLAKIIHSCVCHLLLAGGDVSAVLRDTIAETKCQVAWLDPQLPPPQDIQCQFSLVDIEHQPDSTPSRHNHASDPAHILHTSGSTGSPKGVVITHDNVNAFLDWAIGYFGISRSDRLSGHSPLHFDLSMFDIFGALSVGAELHLVSPECNLLPSRLATWIRESRVTQWFSVPSALNYMAKFEAVGERDFPHLKRILWCGEVLAVPALRYWMTRVPHATFTNLYGPTETTIASSYYRVEAPPGSDTATIPIGRACGDEKLLVLDEDLHEAPPEQVGDLYIGGAGLSPGYWRSPEQTAGAFITLQTAAGRDERLYRTGDLARADRHGLIYFVGRKDMQVKSRGYRIELGEIETALHKVESLCESAVVAVPTNGFDGVRICCSYVPRDDLSITPAILRAELTPLLPAYMIPTHWEKRDVLPKNSAGKIDRQTLKAFWLQNGTAVARSQ
jgi:amino acid adenylation domain-containing protein